MKRIYGHIRSNIYEYTILVLFLVSLAVWFMVFQEDRRGVLTIAFLNVGQGDAIFIESPTGVQVLIDAGPGSAIRKELSAVMPWYDRHIDMIVATHSDRDHFEGFIPFFDMYTTDVVLYSGTESESGSYDVFEKRIERAGVPYVVAKRGQRVDLGGGAYLDILFPDRDVSGLETNDASVVMRLAYGDTHVMLQGDSPMKIEEHILRLDPNILQSDILKAGHHGSKTSTSEAYVKAVDPEWAIISAGKGNSYGHPHKEVVDVLTQLEVEILGTYDGRIVFESDGKSFSRK